MIRFSTLFLVLISFPAMAASPLAARGTTDESAPATTGQANNTRPAKAARVDETSNTQLTGRPTVSVDACGVVIDAEHVSAKNTIDMMDRGVDCMDAATRRIDAGTRLFVSIAGIDKGVATFANGDMVATGQAAPFAAVSSGNGGFMPGMMMPGLGQMGTLAFQSASMGGIVTPPPAAAQPVSTPPAAPAASRVAELEREVAALRKANDALSAE